MATTPGHSRLPFLLGLLAILATAAWCHADWQSRTAALRPESTEVSPAGLRVPPLPAAPALSAALGQHAVWGQTAPEPIQAKPVEVVEPPLGKGTRYVLSREGYGEFIQAQGRERPRWELHAVFLRGPSRLCAFYEQGETDNPWRLLTPGEELAPGLAVAAVAEQSVRLRHTGIEAPSLTIHLFPDLDNRAETGEEATAQ